MLSNQVVKDNSSQTGAESKTIESEIKIETEDKESSNVALPVETKQGDKEEEKIMLPTLSNDALNSLSDKTKSETRKNEEINRLNSEKDSRTSDFDSVVSRNSSIPLEDRVLPRKRAFTPDAQDSLVYRGPNLRFPPIKRGRFVVDDNLRIGRIDSLGPVSTKEVLPSPSETMGNSASTVEVFDDAEGDNTFDFVSYKRAAEAAKATKTASAIRSDLVAAILGSPSISTRITQMPVNILSNDEKAIKNDDLKRRRVMNKKAKKKSTAKERIAAVAILDGEIDLLRILPKDDCIFLGKKCFIFTLRQLEWVLDNDVDAQKSLSRQKVRRALAQNLREYSSKNNDDTFAAEKFELWKRMIDNWRSESRGVSDDDQFPLVNGPMSVFFPVGTLQFIESIKVKSLFDFLCLKKTESGLAVEMFRTWRKKCGLKDLNLLPLAKHLIGINLRIEECLKRKFDAEEDFMKWVAGPMVILSGAAKDFLVDYAKVFSGTEFIDTKTKILADRFCAWRSKAGLSALRGSGNVAMISAWKTQIKDELEIEKSEGKVIPEEEIGDEIESIQEAIPNGVGGVGSGDHRQQRKRRKVTQPISDCSPKSSNAALNSTDFFAQYFKDERKLAMFKSVGITTAQNLLDTSKGKNSDLLKALVQYKSEQNNGKEIQIASCVSLLYDWAARLKKKANEVDRGASEDVVKKVVQKERKSEGSRNLRKKIESTNPFDALSKSSKEFLVAGMNITTASEFLETRTTDIANAFIRWRVEKGMPPLKGLGAVASISGWKKLVRTKAASIGDSNLVGLNRTRHTKITLDEAKVKQEQVENRVGGFDDKLEALGLIPDEGKAKLSSETRSRTKLSVLSYQKRDVFCFELETRKVQSKGTATYIRYLGHEPQNASGLNTDNGIHVERECIVVKSDLLPKQNGISGRKPYNSLTHGAIELSDSIYDPSIPTKDKNDDLEVSLEEVIKKFLVGSSLRSEEANITESQTKSKEPPKVFNVFEVLRNGKRIFMLHLNGPIEKGQSVELRCLPIRGFDMSQVTNGSAEAIRNTIQDRLRVLPAALLLQVLGFLKTQVALLDDSTSNSASALSTNEGQSSIPSLSDTKSFVTRRRIHWVAVKIYENLRNTSSELVEMHLSKDLLWTETCVAKVRDHPGMENEIAGSIREETRQEIEHEFKRREFDDFASSLNAWCPLAKRLFNEIATLFAKFSTEVGGVFTGDKWTNDLRRLVAEVIQEFRRLSQSAQHIQSKELSKIALVFGENTLNDSNIFPKFEKIKEKYFLQPYRDAMSLCNEPVLPTNSLKEARFVATKRTSESNKNESTYFEELHDVQIREQKNIDVLWYIDKQILGPALSSICCGVYTSTPVDRKKAMNNIELLIREAAHEALAEITNESMPLKASKLQQRALSSILLSEEMMHSAFYKRLLSNPSSLPFFFGFVWPLLRGGGWKLRAGSTPTDVRYFPPIKVGTPNQVSSRRDSVTRQRTRLAKQCSGFGLGYIPKLTRRLLVKCTASIESSSPNPDKVSSGPSTKVAFQNFASSLMLSVGKTEIEEAKIQGIMNELTSLFNKLVPLTFKNKDECQLPEGNEWCDVLDCRYLFKFLIIIPDMLQEANVSAQQYSQTICVVHELLTYLSDNHQKLFDERVKLPNEEYHSEPCFPSKLPSQIQKFSQKNLELDLGKSLNGGLSEDESAEIILPKDRADLTDFVSIVMSQAIIGRSTVDHSSRHGIYRAGHPFIVCRHCLGTRKGGKYFYGNYESMATSVTAMEKHILRCADIDDEVKQESMKAKFHHSRQKKNLPFGSQSAFFVRLFNRMQAMARTKHDPELHDNATTSSSTTTRKRPFASSHDMPDLAKQKPDTSRVFSSHLDVLEYIQSVEPWKNKKDLERAIAKYYSCLDYGGKLNVAKKSDSSVTSEWLYSKLSSLK